MLNSYLPLPKQYLSLIPSETTSPDTSAPLNKAIECQLSCERWDQLDYNAQRKALKHIKPSKLNSASHESKLCLDNIQFNMASLRKKAIEETNFIINKLLPSAEEVCKMDCRSGIKHSPQRLATAMVILYLTASDGKITEDTNTENFKKNIQEALDEFEATGWPQISPDDTLDIALMCACQRPFTTNPNSLALYTLIQSEVFPALIYFTDFFNNPNFSTHFSVKGTKKLRSALTFFKQQNIADLLIHQKNNESYNFLPNLMTTLHAIIDYLSTESGYHNIELALYPKHGLVLSDIDSLNPLRELHDHLSCAWPAFHSQAIAYNNILKIEYEKFSEYTEQDTLNLSPGKMIRTQNFAIAALNQYRANKRISEANGLKFEKLVSVAPFKNGFAPIGREATSLYQKASRAVDKGIMGWSMHDIGVFKRNEFFRHYCSFGQHYRHSSNNFLSKKSLTREEASFQPTEVLPEADAFLDTYDIVKEYATLMLVSLRETT